VKTISDLRTTSGNPLSRRGFFGNLGKGLSLAALAPEVARHIAWATGQQSPARKPNILLILADDLGYGDLGIQGCPDIPTPNIDAIAKNGVRFTNGYVSCPICAPTRAGLMTGRYQQRFGFETNPGPAQLAAENFGLPKSETTLAERLKGLGYVTGMTGKWHLGFKFELQPTKRGFDEFYGFLSGAHPYLPASRQMREGSILRGTEPVEEKEYLTDAIAREAVAFIDRHKSEPFFLYVPFNAVHAPMEGAQKYLDRFKDIKDDLRRTHAAMLSALDDAVGRITARIREAGLEENTLVIFLSDNGGPTTQTTSSNAPLRGYKGQALEGGIRIPFMVQWKGRITPGRTDDRPVIALDLHPTAVAAAGAAVDPAWKLDGVNLLPYLTGANTGRPHETLFWRMGMRQRAVRAGDLKLVWSGSDQPELHDLAKDPGEQKNLAAERPEDVKRLQALWQAWDKEMMAPQWQWSDGQTTPARQRQNANAGANTPANERQLRLRFDTMDKNKDGILSPDEVPRPQIFKQMDKNGDGKVTLDEAREFYRIRKK
jgi:arylsulfatase A-like enzyme